VFGTFPINAKIWRSCSGDFSGLGCDIVVLSEQFSAFWRITLRSSSGIQCNISGDWIFNSYKEPVCSLLFCSWLIS